MAKKMIINCANCDARKVSEETLAAYEEAVKERYRFFSFGDCMLIQ